MFSAPLVSPLSCYLNVVFLLGNVIELCFVNAIGISGALLDSLQQPGPGKNFLCDSVSIWRVSVQIKHLCHWEIILVFLPN